MSQQANGIYPVTVKATAALTANRFTTFAGAVPATTANALGVTRQTAAIGDAVTVDFLGSAIVEAGAAIAAGATVNSDATGRAITWASGAKLGLALQAASAAGAFIEVLLIPNVA